MRNRYLRKGLNSWYSGCPVCSGSRTALMTGRLPYHVFETSDYVDAGFNMLPAKLRQVGYVSHSPSPSTCAPLIQDPACSG